MSKHRHRRLSHARCCHGNVRNDHLCDARDGSSLLTRRQEEEVKDVHSTEETSIKHFPLLSQNVLDACRSPPLSECDEYFPSFQKAGEKLIKLHATKVRKPSRSRDGQQINA